MSPAPAELDDAENAEFSYGTNTAGQFGFLSDPQNPDASTRIIFTTFADGVHIIGD